jgi:hypothetical protein
MATLNDFLRTGRLGPLILGMSPNDVMTALGDADEISKKSNPLQLKYGCLQLTFWKASDRTVHKLREMVIAYEPFLPMPHGLTFTDWKLSGPPTKTQFKNFYHEIGYLPVHMVVGPSGSQLIFLSGVIALMSGEVLHSIRLSQRESKESDEIPVSDQREPSPEQIREMLAEADQATAGGALRAALMSAWAGLEAALRRAVLRAGGQGRIGIQPSILLRELFSAKELTSEEHATLEKLRQIRTSVAHGLAPLPIEPHMIDQLKSITERLLGPSVRKQKEVGYIAPVEAIEAYSILANNKHYKHLAEFLRSKGLNVHIEENAVGGDDPQHDIQIKKEVDFSTLSKLIDDWKIEYQKS